MSRAAAADAARPAAAAANRRQRASRRRGRAMLSIVLGFGLLAGACGAAGWLAWQSGRTAQELRAVLDLVDAQIKDQAARAPDESSHVRRLTDAGQHDAAAGLPRDGAGAGMTGRLGDPATELVGRLERAIGEAAARQTLRMRVLLWAICAAILGVIGLALWLLRDTQRRLRRLESRQFGLRRLAGSLESRVARRTRLLAEANQRFDAALAASGVTVFAQDSRLAYTWISNPVSRLSPDLVVGRRDADIMPPASADQMDRLKRQVLDTGLSARAELRIARDTEQWFDVVIQPLTGAEGAVCGVIGGAVEITARKQQEAHIHHLMREVTHRSKNLLSVIQAILRQTASNSTSTDDFILRFSARVQSLAQSHDLLVEADWRRASIPDIVRSQLGHYADRLGGQIDLDGEVMHVRPDASQHIGMALHELATNAAKYGALSVPSGRVRVRWGRSPGSSDCFLSWAETGGPPVRPPVQRGFGRVVTERAVARAVGGTVTLLYPPHGIEWTLTFPASVLI